MSIEIMNLVWKYSKATNRARLVLLAIADHQGEIGAWPSISTLAKMVNASERSVQRDIDWLVEIGELEVHYQQAPTKNHYKSNLYFVKLAGVTDFALGVTNAEGGVTNTQSGVTTVGVQNLNKNITEPLENSIVNEMFDTFWKEYPKKADKRAAFKAFKSAMNRTEFEVILAGTIKYANDPNLPDAKFIKNPATWLNADAWENGPLPEQKKKNNYREEQERILKEWGEIEPE